MLINSLLDGWDKAKLILEEIQMTSVLLSYIIGMNSDCNIMELSMQINRLLIYLRQFCANTQLAKVTISKML